MRLPIEATWIWRTLYVIATIIRPLFLRLRVEGTENIPPTGGAVVACNHTMGPDYVILGYASTRQVYYMAKSEIFYFHPWLTQLIKASGAFPIRRGQHDSNAIEMATEMVRSGKLVGMFPEGTRSRSGRLQRGRSGAARIALEANAPILPVVVIGSEPVLPDLLKLRRRPLVTVRFGKPIYPDPGIVDAAAIRQLTTETMFALAALLPPALRGYYADVAEVERKEQEYLEREAAQNGHNV